MMLLRDKIYVALGTDHDFDDNSDDGDDVSKAPEGALSCSRGNSTSHTRAFCLSHWFH